MAERPILQQSQNIIQPKTRAEISIPESSQLHDKVMTVPTYVIPQAMSGGNSISSTIKSKTIQDTRWEIQAYADPIYRPPPDPTDPPFQEIPRKLTDLDTDINMDFVEIPHIKKMSYQKCTKGQIGHISRKHQNWKV